MNFFDTEQFKDINSLTSYVSSHTGEQLAADVRASGCDPNDILTIGDEAYFFLKNRSAARIFYELGLEALKARPDLLADDINPVLSGRNLCAILVEDGSFQDALRLVSSTPEIIQLDPKLVAHFAYKLYEGAAYRQALFLLEQVVRVPQSVLLEKMDVPLSSLQSLYSAVRAKALVRRLGDLNWFRDPDVDPIPDALLSIEFDALVKRGLPKELAGNLRSAVVKEVSNDRKMWFVFFYDKDDPTPIMDTHGSQIFFASFYNRDGNVQVADVHC